jgi:HAD superfamily hydrolase (TIGR01662 family)
MKGVIFDLDQTIIDSSIAEKQRSKHQWSEVYTLLPHFKLYDGMRELMSELRHNNYKIAIVTTSPGIYAERVLDHFGIEYNSKVCFHDVSRRKPYEDQYLKAMELLKLTPSKTFALGDRAIDVQAAHNAKIKSCACYWGSNEKENLRKSIPTHNFEAVIDAINFFRHQHQINKLNYDF